MNQSVSPYSNLENSNLEPLNLKSSKKVVIVKSDYANLYSVSNAFKAIGIDAEITDNKAELLSADLMVCPGVGSFGQVKNYFDQHALTETLQSFIKSGKPFLGICVGMQMLFEKGYEGEIPTSGLGVFKGEVVLLPPQVKRIPHIGWNNLTASTSKEAALKALFASVTQDNLPGTKSEEVYFVHSYYCSAKEACDVLAYVEPVEGFAVPAIVAKDNVLGVQFHPERSGEVGLNLLRNFVAKS